MSTLEQTVSMPEALSEEDFSAIHDIPYRSYTREHSPYNPLVREKVLQDLQVSREQIDCGQCKEFGEAVKEIKEKYDLNCKTRYNPSRSGLRT